MIHDVAVVGLGAMGSSALYHVAGRGIPAIGIERFTLGHAHGSSHGDSRAIRLAYFEHPSYVPLVRAAYDGWRELECRTGEKVLTITGVLEAGAPGAELVQGSLASSLEHAIPHERLTARQVGERFPAFTLPPDWEAVYQADGGFLRPELAISLYLKSAAALGAETRFETTVRAIEPRGDGVRLVLDGGKTIEAASVIVAAGPWIGELVPELAPHLALTRQVTAWFHPSQPALVTPERFPVFLLQTRTDVVYGFPDFAGTGVKAASHLECGRLAKADDARQDAEAQDARRILDVVQRCIPAAAGPVRDMKTCIYTRTPDSDFVLDLHPVWPQIVLASPCSGHGFKFASVIGEILADLATSRTTAHDISRFGLARLAAH